MFGMFPLFPYSLTIPEQSFTESLGKIIHDASGALMVIFDIENAYKSNKAREGNLVLGLLFIFSQ